MTTSAPAAPEAWQAEARAFARRIRRRVLDHTIRHDGGYLSQACSAAEILATLYTRVMRLGASEAPPVPPPFAGVPGPGLTHCQTGRGYNGPRAPDLDRFILAPVHYALVLYAALVESGRMAEEGLAQFNQDGGTVEMIGAEHSPGHEVTSGSLGQGLSQAAGIALGRRLKGETGRVWVFMSDGEFQSGQTWETLNVVAYHRLDRIGVYVDVNGQQCDGPMDDVMTIEPLTAKLQAFGARVVRVDGHDVAALAEAAELAPDGRPLVVLAYTDPARDMPVLEARRPRLHYVRFSGEAERERYRAALAALDAER